MTKTATFKTDWHGVPAGTALEVVRQCRWLGQAEAYYEVRRVDGEKLPTSYGKDNTSVVSVDYLSLTPAEHTDSDDCPACEGTGWKNGEWEQPDDRYSATPTTQE